MQCKRESVAGDGANLDEVPAAAQIKQQGR